MEDKSYEEMLSEIPSAVSVFKKAAPSLDELEGRTPVTAAVALPPRGNGTAAVYQFGGPVDAIDTTPITQRVENMAPELPSIYNVPMPNEWLDWPLERVIAWCVIHMTYPAFTRMVEEWATKMKHTEEQNPQKDPFIVACDALQAYAREQLGATEKFN